jgi:hypothetical protein
MTPEYKQPRLLAVVVLLLLAPWVGCQKADDDTGALVATTPVQAASQLEQAFAEAPPAARSEVEIVSQALRNGEFEKAVVSLEAVRARENITLEQGLAIHSSVLTLEDRLVRAMDAGDENARRAYELLKRVKRN